MKPVSKHVWFILAGVCLLMAACEGSTGASELTPLGPSRVEMTASAAPRTPTQTRSTEAQPESFTIPQKATLPEVTPSHAPPTALHTLPPALAPTIITATPCGGAWFTPRASHGSCPDAAAVQLEAAYQTFEHGAMLWRRTRGYIILPFNPSTDVQSGVVSFYPDPIMAYRDTAAGMSPPAGLLEPVSGFGLVWRGDIFDQPGPGFQSTLGWATAPEQGYTVTEQTGTQAVVYGGSITQSLMSFFTLPDGRLLYLSRLALPNQLTSLNILSN